LVCRQAGLYLFSRIGFVCRFSSPYVDKLSKSGKGKAATGKYARIAGILAGVFGREKVIASL